MAGRLKCMIGIARLTCGQQNARGDLMIVLTSKSPEETPLLAKVEAFLISKPDSFPGQQILFCCSVNHC